MARITIEETQGAVVFRCEENLDRRGFSEIRDRFSAACDKVASGAASGVIIDLQGKYLIDPSFLREVTPFCFTLKTAHRPLYLIRIPNESAVLIQERGMERLMFLGESVEEVLVQLKQHATAASPPSAQAKVDVNFINPIIDAVISTLKVQCSTDVRAGRPCRHEDAPKLDVRLAGVIAMVGPSFNGSIAICFAEPTFLGLMSSMLGETFTEINQDLQDGAGELLNISFGQAKAALNQKGYAIEQVIPKVVSAVEHESYKPMLAIPFETQHGPLRIEICVS